MDDGRFLVSEVFAEKRLVLIISRRQIVENLGCGQGLFFNVVEALVLMKIDCTYTGRIFAVQCSTVSPS